MSMGSTKSAFAGNSKAFQARNAPVVPKRGQLQVGLKCAYALQKNPVQA